MISVIYTIMCDYPGCGHWTDEGVSYISGDEARRQLRGTGWRLDVRSGSRGRGVRDYCPAHANPTTPKETDR